MTVTLSCEALRDDILALLYDDGDPSEKTRARDHLALCVPCRTEYAGLKSVRKSLGGWTLPASSEIRTQPPRTATLKHLSTGLAAAAGLLLGLGLAVAGRAVLTPSSGAASSSPTASASFVSYDQFQEALKAQEIRHQTEIADLRRTLTEVSVTAPGAASQNAVRVSNMSPEAFERLLKASEERQARLFEARLAGLRTETDLQRQYDMAQIAAGLAYIDSRTGADAARTSELMKNLVRVTAKPQDR